MLEYSCPSCQESLRIPPQFAGLSGRCKRCGAPMRVPQAPTESGGRQAHRIEALESFHTLLEATDKKNKDGAKRQVLIAQCQVGELLRLMKPSEGKPSERTVGICRNTGHQLGHISGELAEWVIQAQQADEWIETEIIQITEAPRSFGRKPALGLQIALRRFGGDLIPQEAAAARRFRSSRFPYEPQKESDGRLLARVAQDLSDMGPAPETAVEKHFRYHRLLKAYYGRRDYDDDALHLAIIVSQMQIALADEVRNAMRQGEDKKKALPRHGGFELLAIIREKQALYDHAIEICEQARKQGWFHDWSSRIERCEKKLVKRNNQP